MKLTSAQSKTLLATLQTRFEQHPTRHPGLDWKQVRAKLEAHPAKLRTLHAMEDTGGEPDVVGQENGEYVFFDCSPESPKGRTSLCYDLEGLESRKKFKPENSAVEVAKDMGIALLTEKQYRELQQLGEFDLKTSSWVKTPPDIRSRGGALFGDRRFGHVFIYHNGAQSYYGARGFRGVLRV